MDYHLNSALHYAKTQAIVKLLLENAANPASLNKWNQTPEQVLADKYNVKQVYQEFRNKDCFEQATKANVHWFDYFFNKDKIYSKNAQGCTLLHVACSSNHVNSLQMVRWLCSNGCMLIIDEKQFVTGNTACHFAALANNVALVHYLVKQGAKFDIPNMQKKTVQAMINVPLSKMNKVDKFIKIKVRDKNTGTVSAMNISPETCFSDIGGTVDDIFTVGGDKIPNSDIPSAQVVMNVVSKLRSISNIVKQPITLVKQSKQDSFINLLPVQNKRLETVQVCDNMIQKVTIGSKEKVDVNIHFGFEISFPPNCLIGDSEITIKVYDVWSCSFELSTSNPNAEFNQQNLPIVHSIRKLDGKAQVYFLSSNYWFSCDSPSKGQFYLPSPNITYKAIRIAIPVPQLPILDCIHNNFYHENAGNMRISIACPLEFDNTWITCYHGTNILNVPSILHDGLVMPNTFTSSDRFIAPPRNHIALAATCFGIQNFANAIFVSPSIAYASSRAYAEPFKVNENTYLPILEVKVKKGKYSEHPSTTSSYKPDPQDPVNVEYRITDRNYVHIVGVILKRIN